MNRDNAMHILTTVINHLWQERISEKKELERIYWDKLDALDGLFRDGLLMTFSPKGSKQGRPLAIPSLKGLLSVHPDGEKTIDLLLSTLKSRYVSQQGTISIDGLRKAKVTSALGSEEPWHLTQFGEVNCALWALGTLQATKVLALSASAAEDGLYQIDEARVQSGILRVAPLKARTILSVEATKGKPPARPSAPPPTEISVPDLSFVRDDRLRAIVARDLSEALKCVNCHAWKATLIMSGSAIEALLLDKIMANEATARAQAVAPKGKLGDWKLAQMIDVAASCGWLAKTAENFSDSVRDYRNLVHPEKERSGNYKVEEPEAHIAINVLKSLIRDLR